MAGLYLIFHMLVLVAPQVLQHDIILILTDDQPWHLQRFMPLTNSLIADQGITFTNGFTSTPVCCPSRANILTGQYSHNNGVAKNDFPLGGAPAIDDSRTIAVALQTAGYRTGLFGKYANHYSKLKPWPYVPPGWSRWFAFADEASESFYDYDVVDGGKIARFGNSPDDYSTDVLARAIVDFINSTPLTQRLLVYFAPAAPHGPATPAPQDVGAFSSLPPYRPPNFNEADVRDKPQWVKSLSLVAGDGGSGGFYRQQIKSLQAVDRAVRAIVDALQVNGRLANTALIFTSDNGFSYGSHRWTGKNCIYDECNHVPFLIRAPAGVVRSETYPVLNVDIAPTIADWAGTALPWPVDGVSLASLVINPLARPARTALLETLLGDLRQVFQGVRTEDYVYGEYENGDREFYDLNADPYQLSNEINEPDNAAVIAALRAQLNALRPRADIRLTMSATPAVAAPGQLITYTATVTNLGPKRGVILKVLDTFPSSLIRGACTATNGGACAGTGIQERVLFASLDVNESAMITMKATVRAGTRSGTVIQNTARSMSFPSVDAVNSNNAATAVVKVK